MAVDFSTRKSWCPKKNAGGTAGSLQGDAAGTAEIAAMNYPEGRLNAWSYRLGIGMAGASQQICGCKFMPKINLARVRMVERGKGSLN